MLELRSQYVDRFADLSGVEVCAPHDGEFRDGEVARLGATRTPAVYVSCMGMPGDMEDYAGPLVGNLAWVAFVLVRSPDAVREGRRSAGDLAAMIALGIVWQLLRGDEFAAAREDATKVRAQNLFGTTAAQRGHTLWAVTWQQPTEITPEGLEAVLDAFRTLHTDFDLPPDEGVDIEAETTLDIDRDLDGTADGEATVTGTLES